MPRKGKKSNDDIGLEIEKRKEWMNEWMSEQVKREGKPETCSTASKWTTCPICAIHTSEYHALIWTWSFLHVLHTLCARAFRIFLSFRCSVLNHGVAQNADKKFVSEKGKVNITVNITKYVCIQKSTRHNDFSLESIRSDSIQFDWLWFGHCSWKPLWNYNALKLVMFSSILRHLRFSSDRGPYQHPNQIANDSVHNLSL